MAAYSYRDLRSDEIRLLRILPVEVGNDAICCEIGHYSLNNAPAYQAFSYAWTENNECQTSSSPTQSVLISGRSLRVQHNLFQLLLRMRENHKNLFWADAICINQEDLDERGKQVSRMFDIFQKAESVIVWLGMADHNSDSALQFLSNIAEGGDIAATSDWIKTGLDTRSHDLEWLAVKQLLARSWWSRTWVKQEVASAQKVTVACGQKEVDWSTFARFTEILSTIWREIVTVLRDHLQIELDQAGLEGLNAAKTIRELRLNRSSISLLQLNHSVSTASTTEAVDKLYGILSLATDADTIIPEPSYTMPLRQVFIDVVSRYTKEYQSLNILSYCGRPKSVKNLPSWTPDFSSRTFFNSITEHPYDKSKLPEVRYRAAGQMPMNATICAMNGIMTAKGFVFGKIDGLGVCAFARDIDGKQDQQPNCTATMYGDNDGIVLALWRTIVGDRVWTSAKCEPAPPEFGEHFLQECLRTDVLLGDRQGFQPGKGTKYRDGVISDFEKWYQENRTFNIAGRSIRDRVREVASTVNIAGAGSMPCDVAFETTRSLVCWGKRLFTTTAGHMGMAPAEARHSDEVCVLYGCSMPMVLRRAKEGSHELIGECFVEGIMAGESLQGIDIGLTPVQDFVLV